MADITPLAHRFYLAEVERLARAQRGSGLRLARGLARLLRQVRRRVRSSGEPAVSSAS